MTRDETKKIIMIITSSYPNWKPLDLSFTVDTWNTILTDYRYEDIAAGLKAFIVTDTSGFAPSIGQVVNMVHTITSPAALNEMEAWGLVSNALRNGYYGAEQEFEKLPPLVQKAVGTSGQLRNWSQTDMESIESVAQSNFMRTYRTVVQRDKEMAKLPEDIKRIISHADVKMLDGR